VFGFTYISRDSLLEPEERNNKNGWEQLSYTDFFKAEKEGLYFISISSRNWTFQTDSSPSIEHKSAEKRGDAERRKEECKPLLAEDNSSLMKDFNHLMKEHIQHRAKRNEGHHF